ncbi:DUF397 domain-containing protein [Streptomyces sp. Ru73]|uniref:DUF397 domain-containing protein n=1 Tax=Streptomyces sp. Ru73 TaxID=2080748 RepID=UPI000CDE361F|nr:DUF397 domain-containing protein [Streptomyces sp. Ru73]POX39075.1 DUF397 domain-containing protein [Streptomyces sp. Ru73]
MSTILIPTGVQWRKSSYSADAECVECAALGRLQWRKSSYSGDTGGDCVEVAQASDSLVAIRDSKDPHGAVVAVSAGAFADFVAYVR